MEELQGIDKCAEALQKPGSTVEELNVLEKPGDTAKLKDTMEDSEEISTPTKTMEKLEDVDKPVETVEEPAEIMEEPDKTGSPVEPMKMATEVEEAEEKEKDNSAETVERKTPGSVEELNEVDRPVETMEKSSAVEELDEMVKPVETTEMAEELRKSDSTAETVQESRRMIEELEGPDSQAATEKSTEIEKELVETPKSAGFAYIIYQALGAIAVGVGGLVANITMGYTSPALPSMRADPDFHITEEQESWVGAVMPACGLIGSVVTGPIVDHLGRRATLLYLAWPFMLSWSIIATSEGVAGVVLGRMLGGFCVGVQTAAGSVFLPETIQLDLRNTMFIFPSVLGTLGLLVSFAAGQYLTWRELAWLGASLCLPILALLYLLPETPQHLTRIGKKKESLAALRQLRRTAQEAELEQEEIDGGLSRGGSDDVSWREIVQPPNLWPVGVAAALMLAQQTTGINSIVFFASTILEAGGGGGSSSVLLGVVNLLATLAGSLAVAKCERRRLLAASTVALVASLLVLALWFRATEAWGPLSGEAASLVPVVALVAYVAAFAVAWGPVPWIFLGEGIPSRVRGKAVAWVTGVCWLSAFLVTKSFAWSLASVGAHNTFLGYAAATAGSTVAILRYMPETYGRSNSQMDRLYQEAAEKKRQ